METVGISILWIVVVVSIGMALVYCLRAWRLASTLVPQNKDLLRELGQACVARDEARRERDNALDSMGDTEEVDNLVERNNSLLTLVKEVVEERDASQRSVDSLGNALKEARARENILLRRVKKMQELQQKLGNSLEVIYTDLKLREES